ncbi:hypothetical protein KI387_008779, partial [Taxus chinensis]
SCPNQSLRGAPLLCPCHISIAHHHLSSGDSVPVSRQLRHIQQTTFTFQFPNLIAQSLIDRSASSRRRFYPVDADPSQSTPILTSRRRSISIDADSTQSTPISLQIGKRTQ